ncbi:MAG: helix-turn-helix transcriptional regulator [Candidatus Lokiarchaeota archaeon]|nr:helix-turn-helix transcriptional regulator [Candidatus Lokiarchaeota archaeon]
MEITESSGLLEIELKNEEEDVVTVIDNDSLIEEIAKALSSKTRRDILNFIRDEPKDVSAIASALNMTEANISAQIKKLESSSLITCDYSSGLHGVRKISKLKHKVVLLKL